MRNFNLVKQQLLNLISEARVLGARDEDINNSLEYLEYNEYGLSLDTIVTQMFEYDIKINAKFFDSISEIAALLEIEEKDYIYIKKLIVKD